MGRKKIYKTDEEREDARKKWWLDYYYKNKEMVKRKNLERYHKNKKI